jgi:hypothetical protein
VSDWLDDFEMMGAKLNEGEKTLMRFAMSKERQRIIRIIETKAGHPYEYSLCNCDWCELVYLIKDVNVL